jgi:hypothetical protein
MKNARRVRAMGSPKVEKPGVMFHFGHNPVVRRYHRPASADCARDDQGADTKGRKTALERASAFVELGGSAELTSDQNCASCSAPSAVASAGAAL